MPSADKKLKFAPREFKGSRLRCLQLTSLHNTGVAEFLTALITPYACVDQDAVWLPRGPLEPGEPELGRAIQFLSDAQRSRLIDWWLAVRKDSARIPNWDIVANCRFGNRPGLTLVEAKAHPAELGEKDSSKASSDNRRQIERALLQAQKGLNQVLPGWALDAKAHYQISNRFAWAWKVASMGVPVVLVYLGFLNATDMLTDSRPILRSSEGLGGPSSELFQRGCASRNLE